jgi:hypothetical protein
MEQENMNERCREDVMKSSYRKTVVTIIPFIALALLAAAAAGLSGRAGLIRTAAVTQQQPPELNGSCDNLLNNLLATGGR